MPVFEDPNPIPTKPSSPWWMQVRPTPPRVIGPAAPPPVVPRPSLPPPTAPQPKPAEPWVPQPVADRLAQRQGDVDTWRYRQIANAPTAVELKDFSARGIKPITFADILTDGVAAGQTMTDSFRTWALPKWMPDWLEQTFKAGVNAVADATDRQRARYVERGGAIREEVPWALGGAGNAIEYQTWRMTNKARERGGQEPLPPPTRRVFAMENQRRVQLGMGPLPATQEPEQTNLERVIGALVSATEGWARSTGQKPVMIGPQPNPNQPAKPRMIGPGTVKEIIGYNVEAAQPIMSAHPAGVLLTAASMPYAVGPEPFVADWWTRIFVPQRDVFLSFFNKDYKDWGSFAQALGQANLDAGKLQATVGSLPMYGTADEVMVYRQTAPWWVQMLAGAVLDPMNLLSMGLTKVSKARAEAKVMDEVSAVPLTVEQVEKSAMNPHPPQWFDNLPLMRITNESKADALVSAGIDVTHNLYRASIKPDFTQVMIDFVTNPDDTALLRATGGYSGSLPAKQTAVMLRRLIGVDSSGAPNYSKLVDVLSTGSNFDSVVELAHGFRKAAESFFPPEREVTAAIRLRNSVYDVATAAYLGWAPSSAARNALNNVFTMVVDGHNPFLRTEASALFLERWGEMPVAGKQAMGAGGEVWKSRDKLEQFLGDLQTPSRWRDIWRIEKNQRSAPMLAIGQNIERVVSDKIVISALQKSWHNAWRRSLVDVEQSVRALNLPPDAHNFVMRRLRTALNPEEVRAIWRDLDQFRGAPAPAPAPAAPVSPAAPAAPAPAPAPAAPVSPAGGAARQPWMMRLEDWLTHENTGHVPVITDAMRDWHKMSVQQALADGLPVPKAVIDAYGLAPSVLPEEVAAKIEAAIGPEGVDLAEEVLRGSSDPKTAQTNLETIVPAMMTPDVVASSAEQKFRNWAETAPASMKPDDVMAHVKQVEQTLDEAIRANQKAQDDVRLRTKGMTAASQRRIWGQFWENLLSSQSRVFESAQAAVEEFASRAGIGEAYSGITRRWFRDLKDTWEKHVSKLQAVWDETDELNTSKRGNTWSAQAKVEAKKNQIWADWRQYRQRLWSDFDLRRLGYAQEQTAAIQEMTAGLAARGEPIAAAAEVAKEAVPLTWDQRVSKAREAMSKDFALTAQQRDLLGLESPEMLVWWYEQGPQGRYSMKSSVFNEFRKRGRAEAVKIAPKPVAPKPVAPAVAAAVVDTDVLEGLMSLGYDGATARKMATGLPDVSDEEKMAIALRKAAPPMTSEVSPTTSEVSPTVERKIPLGNGVEAHLFKTDNGWGAGIFDADAGEYVGGVRRYTGENAKAQAQAWLDDEAVAALQMERIAPKPKPAATTPEYPVFAENTPAERTRLRTFATEQGIPTNGPETPGGAAPRDKVLLKAVSRYLGKPVKSLADLTPNEMNIVSEKLHQRLGKPIDEAAMISAADAFEANNRAALEGEIIAKAKYKVGDMVSVGGRPAKIVEVMGDVDTGKAMYRLEGVTTPIFDSIIKPYKPPPPLSGTADARAGTAVYGRDTFTFGGMVNGSGRETGRTKYRWKAVSLDDLVPSLKDDLETLNPDYPQLLQQRERDRVASKLQIGEIVANPDWEQFLTDTYQLRSGAPMTGIGNNVVEGGNGRVLAWRRMRAENRAAWDQGQIMARQRLQDFGIDPASVENVPDIVLVRERLTQMDDATLTEFVRYMNDPNVLLPSSAEVATDVAKRHGESLLNLFAETDDTTIDKMLKRSANQPFMDAYMQALPPKVRQQALDDGGRLSQQAYSGAKAALLSSVYTGPNGRRLVAMLTEEVDPIAKAVEMAVFGGLPDMAKVEARVARGALPVTVSVTNDFADGLFTWLAHRKNIAADGGLVGFLQKNHMSLIPIRFTDRQLQVMRLVEEQGVKPSRLRTTVKNWAKLINEMPDTNQISMFNLENVYPDPFSLLDRAASLEDAGQMPMYSGIPVQPAVKMIRNVWGAGLEYGNDLMQRAGTVLRRQKAAAEAVKGAVEAGVAGVAGDTVTPGMISGVRQVLEDEAIPEMVRNKAASGRMATEQRHFALGDYSKQRDIHNAAKWLFMYPTWYGFTYANWAKRLVQKPALLSNYARYNQLVYQENLRRYREETGNQGAMNVPPQYARQVHMYIGDHDLTINLDSALNPLYALTEDFRTRQKDEAPLGPVVQSMSSFGPGLFTPLTMGYAMYLKKRGYNDAAEQTMGYVFPQTQAVKSATAWLAETAPATRAVIPPGGLNLEGWLNGNVANGSYWERTRVGYFLAQAWKDGKITMREFQDAAGTHQGPAWEAAVQAEAVARAPTNVFAFFSGLRIYDRTQMDYLTSAMWDKWADIMKRNLPPDQLRRELEAFDVQYPLMNALRTARTQDPANRLESYARMVLGRYGPGWQKQEFLKEIDPLDLVTKFYRTGGISMQPSGTWDRTGREAWSPAEIDAFASVIAEMARRKDVPSADELADFREAERVDGLKQERALDAVNQKQPLDKQLTIDDLEATQREYYRISSLGDPKVAKIYLSQHPELVAWWDEQDVLQKQLDAGMWRAMSPTADYPDSMAAAPTHVGMKPEDRAMAEGFILPGDNWKTAVVELGLKVPQAFWNLQNFEWRKGATQAQVDAAAQDVKTWFESLPQAFQAKWLDVAKMQKARMAQDKLKTQVLPTEFGQDFVDWYYSSYLQMSTDERKAFRAKYPQAADAIYRMYDFLDKYGKQNPEWALYYGYADSGGFLGGATGSSFRRSAARVRYRSGGGYRGGGGGGGSGFPAPTPTPMPAPTPTPGGGFPDATPMTLEQYTALLAKWRADGSFDPLAKMLFGTDIFALADNWYRMTPEQGQAWQQSEAANYGRLMRYLRWLATMVNPANALRSIPQGANPASRPPVPNPLPSRG